ncbi:hypothetical protein Pse7367_2259 [Thalassoporum mexicanum PCC 7367]|uniref:HpsJ-like protein, cyanoexosortase A-associated n=1 Tax=Thalassoporum mexicanum TaxID=3457544 RepID=UPI00029FDF3C|nr:HpsJ family protein [Pseudanabaena sp. PCC 7367]AFY70522.1 hypothetical protein Pse7367_2259 [Pseudanabaena sp. PCC 7367]
MTDELTNPSSSDQPRQPSDRPQKSDPNLLNPPNLPNQPEAELATPRSASLESAQQPNPLNPLEESDSDLQPEADQAQQSPDQLTAAETQSPSRKRGGVEFLGFRLIGYGILALAVLDIGHAAFPLRFMNPAWELEVIEALAARVPMFFVGLIMVLYQKRSPGRRLLQRLLSKALGWGIIGLACLYLLTIPLSISNSLRQDNAYYNLIKSQLLQINTRTQQLQEDLEQASDRDINNLLNQVEDPELLGGANTPDLFRSQASEQLQQFDQEVEEQALSSIRQQRIDNIKNSLRLVFGGLVAGVVLLRIRLSAIPKVSGKGQTEKDIRSLNLVRLPGYSLLLLGFVNYFITLMPPQITNPSWGIFSSSYVAELAPIPIIGLALVFYRSTQGRRQTERTVLKILSWASLVTAILFILLVPLVVVYSVQQRSQTNTQLETQVEQLTVQNRQLRNRIENSTTQEIALLIERQTLRGAPPASQDPEKLRILALSDLDQREQNIQLEMTSIKKQQSQFLLGNFVKRLSEAIVMSCLFIYIWNATAWARAAKYGVIARRRRRPKGGKSGKGRTRRRK